MRGRTILAGALLVAGAFALAPTASADATYTDPAGDVAAQPAGSAVPDNPQVQATDLIGLAVIEGDHDWTFTVSVASFGQQGGTVNAYTTEFTWDDARYRVWMLRSRFDPSAEPLLGAQLQLADGTAWNKVIALDIVEQANKLTVTFEKLYVASLEGHAPVPGSELTDVLVTSRSDFNFGGTIPVQLIDTLEADRPIVYTKGGTSTGHIVLEPTNPVRISNGGSGTFVYTVHVQNRAETEDTVELTIRDLPDGWTAKVHPQYTIPPAEETPVIVLATLPFGHTHGGFSALTLVATSIRDTSVTATVRLGVVHTPIPQPAGHHGELYLHATPSDTGAFEALFPGTINTMNTLAGNADDAPEAYAGQPPRPSAEQTPFVWRINLGPQLAMGLDFDLERTGSIAGRMMGRTTGGATFTAELWLVKGDGDIARLATAAPASLTLDPQNPTAFSFTLTATPEADLVAYAPGQNLQLRLALVTQTPCCPPQAQPTILVEDFVMKLALHEYHEAPVINEAGHDAIATIEATPASAREKRARPGSSVTYAFDVKNTAATPVSARIESEGSAKDLLTIVGGMDLRLSPGGSKRLLVGVRVPSDANGGEVLDALLLIRSTTQPANLALARTSTVVTLGDDAVDDESAFLAEALGVRKDTPALPLLILLAIAGSAAYGRARKRT